MRMASPKQQFEILDGAVLCFGAYGNGNIGDSIQANALYHEVRSFLPDRKIAACTVFGRDYPFDGDAKVPGGALRSAEAMKLPALIMIGGGGLLAHPHTPLQEPEWARNLPTKSCIVS